MQNPNFPRVDRYVQAALASIHAGEDLDVALWREEIARRILEDWPTIEPRSAFSAVVRAGKGPDWLSVEGRARQIVYTRHGGPLCANK